MIGSKRFGDVQDGNAWYYFNYDMPGSTTVILSPNGGYKKGYYYDTFGNTTEGGGSFYNETQFTGATYDKSTGMHYLNARYYNPSTGRFLTQDSYTGNPYDPWTQNLYAYCGNNPVNFTDPTGHSGVLEDYAYQLRMRGEKFGDESNVDNGYDDTIESAVGLGLDKIDDTFGTPLGDIADAVDLIEYIDQGQAIMQAIDESILNYYMNIFLIGGAAAAGEEINNIKIYPIIATKGRDREYYTKKWITAYNTGAFNNISGYKDGETRIKEITGAIEISGGAGYIMSLTPKVIEDCLQFPLATAAGIPTKGVGSILVNAIFDSTSNYYILKYESYYEKKVVILKNCCNCHSSFRDYSISRRYNC